MKVLVIGSGGREHAIAWKLAQSPRVEAIFVAPGNAGSAQEPKVHNVAIDVLAIDKLIEFALNEKIALTIVGPEAPLAAGIVDRFEAAELACFGPSQSAARLESSKTFSKDFMFRHKIPTASYASFTTLEPAIDYIQKQSMPLVIKADGLAAGKGVIIAKTQEEAIDAASQILSNNQFGSAGQRILIETFIRGEELSFIVITDGKTILPFASSQDHKALFDGDSGPNTGGMGAYSPAPIMTPALEQKIMREVIEPTITGMAKEGFPYKGFLYAGLMVNENQDLHVLEYNCRFGDPETQPILSRLQSDFFELCQSAHSGQLAGKLLKWDSRAALGVVLVAGGYPGNYHKGELISGMPAKNIPNLKIFHAGTKLVDDALITNGGRVLCVTALGDSVHEAQQLAYHHADQIDWRDKYCRRDIGYRAIEREVETA